MKTSKDRYADYRTTDYWKAVVQQVKERAGYRCQVCNSQHDLEAHHRTYDHRGREMDHLGDLICLCRRCHGIFHGVVPQVAVAVVPAPVVKREKTKRERRLEREKMLAGLTNIRPHTAADIDLQMPPEGPEIILTHELLARCRANGAFTSATIEALGVAPNLTHGWVGRLVGTSITRERFRSALAGKYIYAKRCFPVSP